MTMQNRTGGVGNTKCGSADSDGGDVGSVRPLAASAGGIYASNRGEAGSLGGQAAADLGGVEPRTAEVLGRDAVCGGDGEKALAEENPRVKNELEVVETGLTSDSPNNVGPASNSTNTSKEDSSSDNNDNDDRGGLEGYGEDTSASNAVVGGGVGNSLGSSVVTGASGLIVPAKIFCGGLCDITTNASLRTHFSPYGEIVDSVVLTEKSTGRSRGFGFITFASEESVDAVLSSPQIVDGKEIDCKRAVPRGAIQSAETTDESSEVSAAPGGGNPSNAVGSAGGTGAAGTARHVGGNHSSGFSATKIFVGGLPQTCSDDKLREHFGKYGTIKNLSVMVDRDTNRHRGFGFVEYESPESVEEVMRHYYDHQIDNKWVECKKALPREVMAVNSGNNSSSSTGNNNTSMMGGPGIHGSAEGGGVRSRSGGGGVSTAASAAAAAAAAAVAANYNVDYFRNPYIQSQSIHANPVASQQIYGRYGGRHDQRYVYPGYACPPGIYSSGAYGQLSSAHHQGASAVSGSASGLSIPPSAIPGMCSPYLHNTASSDSMNPDKGIDVRRGANGVAPGGNGVGINSGYSSSARKDQSNSSIACISEQADSNISGSNVNVYPYHNQRVATAVPDVSHRVYHHQHESIRAGPYTGAVASNATIQGRYAPSGAVPTYSVPGAVQTHGKVRGGMY